MATAVTQHTAKHPGRISPEGTPELHLLIALCARQIPGLPHTSLPATDLVDWDRFLRILEWHRVAGVVDRSLRQMATGTVPEPVAAAIARSAAAGAQHSLRSTMKLAQISRAFAAESLPVAVLKGVPLSWQLFGDLGVRDSRDIDLLVPREDAMRAHHLLTTLGYRRIWPEPDEDEPFLHDFLDLRVHFEYLHATSAQKVELHWRLWESPELGPRECPPSAWETFELQGLQLRVLPHEILLPYLCVHGAKHAWFRMKWLLDVACLLGAEPASGEALIRTAHQWGAEIPAVQALQLSHTLFDTPLPTAASRPGLQARTVIRMAETCLVSGGLDDSPRAVYLSSKRQQFARLLLSRRPAYLLRETWQWLTDLAGWQRYSHRQRALRLVLWIPRWAARRITMLLSS